MKEFWNARYNTESYAYGKNPNQYFKDQIGLLPPGKILLAAEGEGRNAVYAASLGWDVFAYDFSEKAYQKAMALAREKQVEINYQIASLSDLTFADAFFDVIGLIYVHFPDSIRTSNHQKLSSLLKKRGRIILEAFSTNHPQYQKINPRVGGPKMPTQLYSEEKLRTDFEGFEFTQLKEEKITLEEGTFHNGITTVMRMHALK
jgi:SAM-dependent methyltransferase